ncbi:putative pyridoxal kinase [Martiniozyma asiatica (nom. inval.)]|nr:putative pyridoxal kinase [Martiniozyma asiatica]
MTEDHSTSIPCSAARKVLNIQSHVVHGYVGNKATTFPLQMLNWDVDVLNTVNFSNHTGYGSWTGTCTTADQLHQIYQGLKKIDAHYDGLLTGYVNGSEALRAVGEICIDIKNKENEKRRKLTWLLDPVMGDEGEMYVSEDVIPEYRKILETGLVDIVTPNQFELELLMDTEITSMAVLKMALKKFHQKYKVKHVILSSLFPEKIKDIPIETENFFCCVSSIDQPHDLIFYEINKVDGYFTGVGDLFSALLLDRIHKIDDILAAINQVLTVMKKVLQVTSSLGGGNGVIGNQNMKESELKVIESKFLYEQSLQEYDPVIVKVD